MKVLKFKIGHSRKDIIELYSLFFLSVLFIYKSPQIIGIIFQLFLLIAFWQSKRDYFWLAFVFIIMSEPGYLFSSSDALHSFSIWPYSPFGNLYFSLIFLIVASLKYFKTKLNPSFFLKINFILIFSYFFIQLIVFGIYKTTALIRLTLPWLLIFIFPRMFKKEKDLVNFFNLIFTFVFFILVTQNYKILTGLEFSTLLGGIASQVVEARGGVEEVEMALRPIYGIFIPFLAIWGSIYFLSVKNNYFSKSYLSLILGLSVFSIFLTATRSWLIASFFLISFYIVLTSRKPIKTVSQISIITILIFVVIEFLPFLHKQTNLSLQRYETILDFVRGDITAGGTAQRFDVRVKKPLAGFAANPIFGWGVGNEFNRYSDGHVGYHNLLMSSGIIGFTFWMLLWLNFIKKMSDINKVLRKDHPYKKIPLVLIAFAISILIIHTSVQWFGYLVGFNNAFMIALLFTLGHRVYFIRRRMVPEVVRMSKTQTPLMRTVSA